MRKWEDIVKDRLEEQDSVLPDSVFAEFRARRDAAAAARRQSPLIWVTVAAVAACLAALLLLHGPSGQDEGIRLVEQPSARVAVMVDSADVSEPVPPTSLIAQKVVPKAVKPSSVLPTPVHENTEVVDENSEPAAEETVTVVPEEGPDQPQIIDSTKTEMVVIPAFIPERIKSGKQGMKVAPAAGMIAGGGLLAAVAAPLLSGGTYTDKAEANPPGGTISGPTNPSDPSAPKDERTGDVVCYFPLKLGLSARIPVGERLYITTGLDYSLYKSSYTYTLSGEKIQKTHYIGIPVRLDWTLASNKWMDVYIGAGLEGEYCFRATFAGKRIAKDGVSVSLLGAGGVQLKLTSRLGLYIEPELSWTMTPKTPVLETYRSDHPANLLVTTGLRFTIGK